MLNLIDFQNKLNDKSGKESAQSLLLDDATIEISKKIDNCVKKRNEGDLDFIKHIGGAGEEQNSFEAKNQATSIAIGSLDYLLDNERFREYKNKNTITIRSLSQS